MDGIALQKQSQGSIAPPPHLKEQFPFCPPFGTPANSLVVCLNWGRAEQFVGDSREANEVARRGCIY